MAAVAKTSTGPKSTFGPYTPVRQAGDLYFVSGQVGFDPATKTAAADVAAQTQQALTNMQHALAACDLTMGDVIKTTIYLQRIDDFAAINDVYMRWFAEPRPARACVAVAALPKLADTPLLIEIEAVAHKELRSRSI